MGLKAQDVLVVLKIFARGDKPWTQAELADQLGISRAEMSNAIGRAIAVGLLDEAKVPQRQPILEFLQYGIKYVFPVKKGGIGRGVLTTPCAAPLSGKLVVDSEDYFVWPSPDGTAKGQEIEPLYHSVPKAIKDDPELYELLVLVDAIRLGRAKELRLASEELKRRFKSESKLMKAFVW